MSNPKPQHQYFIFVKGQSVPIALVSSVDLIARYQDEMLSRSKKGDWWRALEFFEEDGTLTIVIAPDQVVSIVRGGLFQPKEQATVPGTTPS